MSNQKFICITGMDGTGKSTLVNALAVAFSDVQVASIWDLFDQKEQKFLFSSKQDIDRFLCSLTPDSRILFLAHALKFSIDKAFAKGKKLLLANGYYYKYFTTELALGATPMLVSDLQKIFPSPDLVIELKLPIAESAHRKQALSRYECGLSQMPSKEEFLVFQEKVQAHWAAFDRTQWHSLDASQTPESLLASTISIIKTI